MNVKQFCVITGAVFLTILFAGCGEGYGVDPLITYDASAKNIKTVREGMLWLESRYAINPYRFQPTEGRPLYQMAVDTSDPAAAQMARNRLQAAMLMLSDQITRRHLADVTGFSDAMNIFFGAATSALTGAGAVVGGEVAKASLSAAATGTNSARSLVNEQVYKELLVPAIVRRIGAEQKNFFDSVIAPARDKSISEYTVDEAIADASRYHELGSFYHGVALAHQDIENAASTRRDPATTLKEREEEQKLKTRITRLENEQKLLERENQQHENERLRLERDAERLKDDIEIERDRRRRPRRFPRR